MSFVLICKDAREDVLIWNVALATALVATDAAPVTILFTGEALNALATGTMSWSDSFKGREARATIIRNAESMGLAVADASRDKRWSDIRSSLKDLAEHSQIRMVACPIGVSLLGVPSEEASYLQRIDTNELASILNSASQIVGGY